MNATKSRSAVKAITWRFVGTTDTFLVSYFITKKPFVAASIASLEVLTKTILYYFHERGWNKVKWGKE